MTFISPDKLWLLAAVGALIATYVFAQRRRRQYAVRFTNVALLDSVAPRRPGWRRHVTASAFLVALVALVLAVARPARSETVPREQATVVMAIDTSLSMGATDVAPDRVAAATAAARQFLADVPPAIRIGLVTFNGVATVQVPPTEDRSVIDAALDRLALDEGTAIGEAVFAGLQTIDTGRVGPETGEDEPIPATIVLLSDGETTVGRPDVLAAEAAVDAGVPVSTIAFGTDAGTITVPQEPFPIPVPVNESALEGLAGATGGQSFAASSAGELEAVYADIGSAVGFEEVDREIGGWFTGAAVVLFVAAAGLSLLWSPRIP